jgi:hypothetical protein
MSWLKYIAASLIGFLAAVAFVASSAPLFLWLTFSRYVAWSCANMPPPSDCGAYAGAAYGYLVVIVCILVGLFIGTFVTTTVAIAFYRRDQKSKLATAIFKPDP